MGLHLLFSIDHDSFAFVLYDAQQRYPFGACCHLLRSLGLCARYQGRVTTTAHTVACDQTHSDQIRSLIYWRGTNIHSVIIEWDIDYSTLNWVCLLVLAFIWLCRHFFSATLFGCLYRKQTHVQMYIGDLYVRDICWHFLSATLFERVFRSWEKGLDMSTK